jgi:predicted secreted Zn-dependent protease
MSERTKGFVVLLDHDYRPEEAVRIQTSLEMVRGVLSVTPSISVSDDFWARKRVRMELHARLLELLQEEEEK